MPVIHEITDLTAPELDIYARLTQAQLRNRLEPEKGIFIAESPKVIARALDAGYQPLSLLMERKQITGPAQEILTRCGDVPVYTADRELLAQLTGFALTRGVLCAFRRPAPRTVEQVCAHARRVAVLEGIVDSTNVGAIFRSAAALNMDAVLVTPSCCDPLCRRAVRGTSGTLVYTAVWQGLGKAKMPFYATTIGMWIIRIFSGYFLGVSLGLGLAGVWIATVVDNVWRAIFLYVMYRRYLVKRKF